jgi:hypothetical protein
MEIKYILFPFYAINTAATLTLRPFWPICTNMTAYMVS